MGLAYNPVLSIRRPKPHPGRICRLAPKDEKKLFELIRKHRNPMLGLIAEIALETSMREGEIVKLRTSQVNLKRRIILLLDILPFLKEGDSYRSG
jgi:integrase